MSRARSRIAGGAIAAFVVILVVGTVAAVSLDDDSATAGNSSPRAAGGRESASEAPPELGIDMSNARHLAELEPADFEHCLVNSGLRSRLGAQPTFARNIINEEAILTDTEIGIACGVGRLLEFDSGGYYPTRAEAIQSSLNFYTERAGELDLTTQIPHTRFVQLLTGALAALPTSGTRPTSGCRRSR